MMHHVDLTEDDDSAAVKCAKCKEPWPCSGFLLMLGGNDFTAGGTA